MNIVIPTYKRAKYLDGKEYFYDAKYVLPEAQRDDYLKVLPSKRMIVIPDEVDGNVPRKRNWILDNIPRPLIMIDDDVKFILFMEGRTKEKKRFISFIKLPREKLHAVLNQYTEVAEGFGCKLWGMSQRTSGDEREYKEFRPFSLTNVTLGPFQCHLDHDLRFDEAMGSKDDYDMALQHLHRYKKVLRVEKLAYAAEHGENPGGAVSFRTQQKEIGYCNAIMNKWGSRIIKYKIPPDKMGDLLNGRVSVPINGV